MRYLTRWQADDVRASLEAAPVTVLTGARQVGKSTLLRNEPPFSSWRYVSFDDFDSLAQAERDPRDLWAGVEEVVLDEVQKAPKVLSAVKQAVDDSRGTKRFVLSGSANLLLMNAVSESLAGRTSYKRLLPFTVGEVEGAPPPRILRDLFDGILPEEGEHGRLDAAPYLFRGMMPPVVGLSEQAVTTWWEGYVATYLERDLRQLTQVGSLPEFRAVMQQVAARTGSLFNQTDVARLSGVSQPTVHRYLGVLEATHVALRIPGFAISASKRVSKRPKVYLFDTGLASFLLGLYSEDAVRHAREYGALFENLVMQHLLALADLMTPRAQLFYWRTHQGVEVDFVAVWGRKAIPIEVKSTADPSHRDARGLRAFLDEYGQAAPAAVLVHSGTQIRRLGEKTVAVPWHVIAGAASPVVG